MSTSKISSVRLSPRIHTIKEITVKYEGQAEEIVIRPPNVGARGMFFNTDKSFPEGAVLNLRFRLALSGAEVRTRGEVRYSLPGVGVGVEFVGISAQALRSIEREIQLCKTASQAALRSTKAVKVRAGRC